MCQGRNETFANFLVRMEQFFLCRTIPLPEEDKFDIIWHTMKSTYRDKLALIDVTDLRKLEELCARIDDNNELLMNRFALSFDNQKINELNGWEMDSNECRNSQARYPNDCERKQDRDTGRRNDDGNSRYRQPKQ